MVRGRSLGRLLAGALIGLGGCNLALGIDPAEYNDVAVDLCACEGVSFLFSNCERQIRDSLEDANEDARERWLGLHDSAGCGRCDQLGVVQCLQSPPVCRDRGEPCVGILDCCGSLADSACRGGTCAACAAQGEACESTAECCGAFDAPGVVYCHQGQCFRDTEECLPTLAPCMDDADCCGGPAGVALCLKEGGIFNGVCLEFCLPTGDNCSDCCGTVALGTFAEYANVCLEGRQVAEALAPYAQGYTVCEGLCDLESDKTCPDGTTCSVFDPMVMPGVTVDFCVAPR